MAASDGHRTIVFIVSGPLARADIPELCEQAGVLLRRAEDLIECDVGSLTDPDAVAVEALARLQLTARRLGRRILLRDARRELKELLDLMGLGDVIPFAAGLAFESWRQTEQREQTRRVEEEADPADPSP